MTRKTLVLSLVGVGLVAVAAVGFLPRGWLSGRDASDPGAGYTVAPVPIAPLPAGAAPNFRAVVQQSAPAVVGISVTGQPLGVSDGGTLDLGDPFYLFYRGIPEFQARAPGLRVPVLFRSQGSGFIISADGLVLTNAHLVRDAQQATVRLGDRREYRAQVLGVDTVSDVAVLRMNAGNLPVVRLGDAEQAQVGDPVLAMGAPLGFDPAVSQGIVSARGRSLPGDSAVPFIQTDAVVPPGSSGGPLLDGSGAVVGLNAQIYPQSGAYQGASFAIPIQAALKVRDQILASGRVSHAWLGARVQDLSPTLAQARGLDLPDGALVTSVVPDSAAAHAGLKAGDVVTHANGEALVRSGDLSSRISRAAPGDVLLFKIWRDRRMLEFPATLGRLEEGVRTRASREVVPSSGPLGLALRPLTRDEQAIAQVQGGLLVQRVAGAAAWAGLVPGDVLLTLNGAPLKSVDQVVGGIGKKAGAAVLLIQRSGERMFVSLEPG